MPYDPETWGTYIKQDPWDTTSMWRGTFDKGVPSAWDVGNRGLGTYLGQGIGHIMNALDTYLTPMIRGSWLDPLPGIQQRSDERYGTGGNSVYQAGEQEAMRGQGPPSVMPVMPQSGYFENAPQWSTPTDQYMDYASPNSGRGLPPQAMPEMPRSYYEQRDATRGSQYPIGQQMGYSDGGQGQDLLYRQSPQGGDALSYLRDLAPGYFGGGFQNGMGADDWLNYINNPQMGDQNMNRPGGL